MDLVITKIFYKNGSVFLNYKGKASDFDQDSWTTYSLKENTLRIGSDILGFFIFKGLSKVNNKW